MAIEQDLKSASHAEFTFTSQAPATVSRDLRIAPPSPTHGLNGYHETLRGLLKDPVHPLAPDITNVRTRSNHTVVIMPAYDPFRADVREIGLESLRNQPDSHNHRLVIANNAQDPDKHALLEQEVREKTAGLGFPITVVDATPQDPSQKSAAHARNLALKHIQEFGKHDEAFRGPVYLMDDDTATLPGGIEILRNTLYDHDDAVAVTANIIHVPELTREVLNQHLESQAAATNYPRDEHQLPTVWTADGRIDVAAIVAFSSSIAGKTTGLLMHPEHTRAIVQNAGEMYVPMPYRSAEDMIAATAFGKRGIIYRNPNARMLDEARPTPGQTRLQQHNWGRDHVMLLRDIAALHLAQKGIQVLEPEGDTWYSWTVPGSESFIGSIINPSQLARTVNMLRDTIADEPNAFMDQTDRVVKGTENVLNVLRYVEEGRGTAIKIRRDELPKPSLDNPRGDPNARIGRLAGNIMGMYDVQKVRPHRIPRLFVFGHRQAGSWDA